MFRTLIKMALFICKHCKKEKELKKQTLILIESNTLQSRWIVKESLCKCGNYMQTKTEKGMPYIIRNENI